MYLSFYHGYALTNTACNLLAMTKKDFRFRIACVFSICAAMAILIEFGLWRMTRSNTEKESVSAARSAPAGPRLTNGMSETAELHAMENEIARFMGRWDIRGMQLAVVRNDSLLYSKGFGWADVEQKSAMEPYNIMRIASASKLVTAIGIMKLVEQKKLSLDTPVFGTNGILNDRSYTDAMCNPVMETITVDHLLLHEGGFGLGAGDPMFNTKDIIEAKKLKAPPTDEELVRIVLGRKLAFTPGQGRRYSNFGYKLLSMIIEKVSGQSYWDFMKSEVLNPAGCYDFRPATNYYTDRLADEVKYYGPDSVKVEEYNGSKRMVDRVYGGSNVNGLAGAGGWLTSATDLARLVAAIDKDPRRPDVISAKSVDILTEHSEDEKRARGWVDCTAEGRWTRTGTLSSTHALIERFPNGDCWVILTNTGVWTGHRFNRDLSRLVENLRGRYAGSFPKRNLF